QPGCTVSVWFACACAKRAKTKPGYTRKACSDQGSASERISSTLNQRRQTLKPGCGTWLTEPFNATTQLKATNGLRLPQHRRGKFPRLKSPCILPIAMVPTVPHKRVTHA
ncbi:unnamed protein product, partial [Ectocarpus sp. 12 AP-2014]